MATVSLRVMTLVLVCLAVAAQNAASDVPSRAPRKSKRSPSPRAETDGSAAVAAEQAISEEAAHRASSGGKRKLFHVAASNEAPAPPTSDFGEALLQHVHAHARSIAGTPPTDADDAAKAQLHSESLARAGLDAEGKLIHGIPRTLLARGTRMLPNLARNTSCSTPCGGGSCIYVECDQPVECRGGLCFFYKCDNPRCSGGACKFMECVYPTCAGGACDFVDNVTPLEDVSEFCSGGGCTFEGSLHTGLPAGDAVY